MRIAPIVACVYELLKLGHEENLLLCNMGNTPKALEDFLATNPAETHLCGPDGIAFYDNSKPTCQHLMLWAGSLLALARFDEDGKPVEIEVHLPEELGDIDALTPSTAEIRLLLEYVLANKNKQPNIVTIEEML